MPGTEKTSAKLSAVKTERDAQRESMLKDIDYVREQVENGNLVGYAMVLDLRGGTYERISNFFDYVSMLGSIEMAKSAVFESLRDTKR